MNVHFAAGMVTAIQGRFVTPSQTGAVVITVTLADIVALGLVRTGAHFRSR